MRLASRKLLKTNTRSLAVAGVRLLRPLNTELTGCAHAY